MPRLYPSLVVLLLLALASTQATSATETAGYEKPATIEPSVTHWFSGYSVVVGVAYKKPNFRVKDKETRILEGRMTGTYQTEPVLYIDTPYHYFSDNPESDGFGWYVEYGFTTFTTHLQVVGTAESRIDLGTSISGETYNLTPIMFYNWGDPYIKNNQGQFFKAGLGIGLGYLQAKGDIILTETTNERLNIKFNELTMTLAILFEYRLNNFSIRLYAVGPSTDIKQYDYSMNEESYEFRYVFQF